MRARLRTHSCVHLCLSVCFVYICACRACVYVCISARACVCPCIFVRAGVRACVSLRYPQELSRLHEVEEVEELFERVLERRARQQELVGQVKHAEGAEVLRQRSGHCRGQGTTEVRARQRSGHDSGQSIAAVGARQRSGWRTAEIAFKADLYYMDCYLHARQR